MIGQLPKTLTVGGRRLAVRSDYRVALTILQAMNDEVLTDRLKAQVCIKCLYERPGDITDVREALERAAWFLDGGDMPKREHSARIIDWEQDEGIIFPAVNKAAGCEVRALEYMHWWTFLGYFGEVGEGLLSAVLSIRSKIADGKPLDKYEREFLRRNRSLIVLQTAEEKAAEEETEDFLKTIV